MTNKIPPEWLQICFNQLKQQMYMNLPVFNRWLGLLKKEGKGKFVLMNEGEFILKGSGEVTEVEEHSSKGEFLFLIKNEKKVARLPADGGSVEGELDRETIKKLFFDSTRIACNAGKRRFGVCNFSVFEVAAVFRQQQMENTMIKAWAEAREAFIARDNDAWRKLAAAVDATAAAKRDAEKKRVEEQQAKEDAERAMKEEDEQERGRALAAKLVAEEARLQALIALTNAEREEEKKRDVLLKKVLDECWEKFWDEMTKDMKQRQGRIIGNGGVRTL